MGRFVLLAALIAALVPAWPAGAQDSLPRWGGSVYVEELPEVVRRVEPVYPPDARAARIEGTVTVQVLVDERGRVVDARLVRSIRGLDVAALAAARQWIFKPARSGGQPIAVWVAVPVEFSLGGHLSGSRASRLPGPTAPRAPAHRDIPCPALLSHPPEFWMDGRSVHADDEIASQWALCRRALALDPFRGRPVLCVRLRRLDRQLNSLADDADVLGGIRAGGPAATATVTPLFRAWLERRFSDIARRFADGSAYERSDTIASECRALAHLLAGRVGEPEPERLLAFGAPVDTAQVRATWRLAAGRYLHDLKAVAEFDDPKGDAANDMRASLDVLRLVDMVTSAMLLPRPPRPGDAGPDRLLDSPLEPRRPR